MPRRWHNKRAQRELARIKNFKRDARRVTGRRKNQSGKDAERLVFELLFKATVLGRLNRVIASQRHSWMDFVWKVDIISQNIHGFHVPIQVKRSYKDAEEFVRRHKNFFEKKFGALPVIFVLRHHDNGESQMQGIIDKINNWKGRFQYKEGHLRYSEFFDWSKHKHLGNSRTLRVQEFFKWIKNKKKQRNIEKAIPSPDSS